MEKLRLGAGLLWKASRNSRREKRCQLEVSLMSEAIFIPWVSRKPDSIKKPALGVLCSQMSVVLSLCK